MPELYKDRLLLAIGKALAFTMEKIAERSQRLSEYDNSLLFTEKEIEHIRMILSLIEKAITDKNTLQLNEKQIKELENIYLDTARYVSMIVISQKIIKQSSLCR